jgi:hypothetical protein
MTYLLLSLFLLLPLMVAMPGARQGAQEKEIKSSHEFAAGGSLTVKSFHGSVHMTSWDQNQVEVIAHISAPKEVSDDYARRAIEATRIDVRGGNSALTVEANYTDVPYGDGKGERSRTLPHVRFEIHAPRSLSLAVEADISEVTLDKFEGKIAIDTDRTDVTGNDLTGDIRLRTDRGDATLSGIAGSLDVASDRGDIDIQSAQITRDSRLVLNRGGITLALKQAQGLSLRGVVNATNNFHSDLPIQMRTMRGKRIEGTINGGGPELYFKADRGKIRLKQ